MGNVLVVDDNADTCSVLSKFLAVSGHCPRCANSAAEAMAEVGRCMPDVVIADFMMPRESGIDLLKRLRAERATADLPVIIYTAVSESRYVKAAMAAGASDYWVKGTFRPAELQRRLAAHMPANTGAWSEPRDAHPIHATG